MFDKIKAWFKNSVTIAWARIQIALGSLIGFLSVLDFAPIAGILPPKWSAILLFVTGVITEAARRRTL